MAEPAFVGAGKTAGIEVWRIENLTPVKLSGFNGKLHVGDSYIFLNTVNKGKALAHNIHFWLGNETSQDEAGVAAYKTVELDDSLGGGPIQYRETQGNESSAFLSLFKTIGNLEYLPGGVASGFKHVDRNAVATRLLQVKGRRVVRVWEVKCHSSSLNRSDCFVLDKGKHVFVYCGSEASRQERSKALEVATQLTNGRESGSSFMILYEQFGAGDSTATAEHKSEFWAALGGAIDENNLPHSEDDVASGATKVQLFHISDAGGSVQCEEVTSPDRKLHRDMLQSGDVFMLTVINDSNPAQNTVYLWVGRGSSLSEKKEATQLAVRYLKENHLSTSIPIERLSEGSESSSFISYFFQWYKPVSMNAVTGGRVASRQADREIDMAELLSSHASEENPEAVVTESLKVWRVENFELSAVPNGSYGQFYSGDSYVVQHTYAVKTQPKKQLTVIYFWLGAHSTQDEKGTAALKAKELDDSLGGNATQVRVVQGKEPSSFRSLFPNNLVVYTGGHKSGFTNRSDSDSYDTDGVALFHVKGTSKWNIAAVQVEEICVNLNSSDAFVLVTPEAAFVWFGKLSESVERDVALHIATDVLAGGYLNQGGRTVVPVNEGEEPEEFWGFLKGGRCDYPGERPGELVAQVARLFQCSTATGRFDVQELTPYDQTDLVVDDIMILDTYTAVFLWIGTGASDEEKTKSIEFANKYVDAAINIKQDGRDPDCPVYYVIAGSEPTLFTCHFVNWDDQYFSHISSFNDVYEQKLRTLRAQAEQSENGAAPAVPAVPASEAAADSAAATAASAPDRSSRRVQGSYLNMRNTDMSSRINAANPNAFAYVSPSAAASNTGGPVTKTATSSTGYLNMRNTDMSSRINAANPNAFAYVAPTGGAAPAAPAATAEAKPLPTPDQFVDYDTLVDSPPEHVDLSRREEYLSDEAFQQFFGANKTAFRGMPKWKRDAKKKELFLF